MHVMKWEGTARDYARLGAAVAVETMLGLLIATRNDALLAYIDPGVGAMIVQGLAAVFFGMIFYFKNLRRAISRFFLKLVGKEPAPEQVAATASVPAEKK